MTNQEINLPTVITGAMVLSGICDISQKIVPEYLRKFFESGGSLALYLFHSFTQFNKPGFLLRIAGIAASGHIRLKIFMNRAGRSFFRQ